MKHARGNIHRFQGYLLLHYNTDPVQKYHAQGQSYHFKTLPFGLSTAPHGIHGGGKGGQTDGFMQRYKYPPAPRRLVGKSQIPQKLSPA